MRSKLFRHNHNWQLNVHISIQAVAMSLKQSTVVELITWVEDRFYVLIVQIIATQAMKLSTALLEGLSVIALICSQPANIEKIEQICSSVFILNR